MTLYDRLAGTIVGARALSVARLQYSVLDRLHATLRAKGWTQSHLAEVLGVRKSAVNQVLRGDGNLRISTVAEYLHVMGYELELNVVPLGKLREDAVRDMRQLWMQSRPVSG